MLIICNVIYLLYIINFCIAWRLHTRTSAGVSLDTTLLLTNLIMIIAPALENNFIVEIKGAIIRQMTRCLLYDCGYRSWRERRWKKLSSSNFCMVHIKWSFELNNDDINNNNTKSTRLKWTSDIIHILKGTFVVLPFLALRVYHLFIKFLLFMPVILLFTVDGIIARWLLIRRPL